MFIQLIELIPPSYSCLYLILKIFLWCFCISPDMNQAIKGKKGQAITFCGPLVLKVFPHSLQIISGSSGELKKNEFY